MQITAYESEKEQQLIISHTAITGPE